MILYLKSNEIKNINIKMIGQGTFGQVYRHGKNVVKCQKKYNSFIKEICILKQFNHPNICKIYDFEISDTLNLILEKGRPLLDHFNKCPLKKRLSIRKIISDLVSGILYLNSNGIAHCDIKPHNCIIVKGIVKLIDFGIIQFCKSTTEGWYYKYGNVYSSSFKDPQIDKKDINHNISSELYALCKVIYHLFNQKYHQGIYRKYYISRKTFLEFDIPSDVVDFLMECQRIDSRKTIEELSHHPCLIQSRIHRRKYKFNFWKIHQFKIEKPILKQALYLMKHYSNNASTICRGMDLFMKKIQLKDNGNLESQILTALFISSQLENDKHVAKIDIEKLEIKEYIKTLKGRLYEKNIQTDYNIILSKNFNPRIYSKNIIFINPKRQIYLFEIKNLLDNFMYSNHNIVDDFIELIIRSRYLLSKFPPQLSFKIKKIIQDNSILSCDDELLNLLNI